MKQLAVLCLVNSTIERLISQAGLILQADRLTETSLGTV